MDPTTPTLSPEAVLRIELAASELDVGEPGRALLGRWIRGVPSGVGARVGVGASVALGRTTWRAAGPTSAMLSSMASFFDAAGTDPDRTSRLGEFGLELDPPRIGSWLQVRGEHLDAGWYAPSSLPLAGLWEHVPPSGARDALQSWLDEADIEQAVGFERSLGPSDYAGLWFQLPGADGAAQMDAVDDLMDDLELGSFPEPLRGLLVAAEAPLVATTWLIAEGVARLAVVVPDPQPATMVALAMAVGADREVDQLLARVQGCMDADRPAHVEAVFYGGTADVEVAWDSEAP